MIVMIVMTENPNRYDDRESRPLLKNLTRCDRKSRTKTVVHRCDDRYRGQYLNHLIYR
jgi:hypothetical protein